MSSSQSTYYVTTPIYYVNDRPHIGHVYTTTLADVLARYQRMRGGDVFFLTGTDEHAAKVSDAARERGMSPQQWADQNAAEFEATFKKLGMSHNDFIRTSQERHKRKVSEYVAQLLESGDVYAGQYEGWYDPGQEEYLPENKAKECDFKSPINGKPLVRKQEKNYFFRLSKYEGPLLELMESQTEFVKPEARRNEVIGRIREGLNDVPISRTGAGGWGIPMPSDTDQAIYVWIDALFNYLTTVDTDDRHKYWPANVHLIAKDILWFHAVIWPAMLMAMDKPLPKLVYAHSFWIAEGKKMSKSLGNFVDLEKIDGYAEQFSLDALRYFLVTRGPLGSTDSDFAHAKFVETYNTDLANTVGNCASRVTNMISRYFDGTLPEYQDDHASKELRAKAEALGETVDGHYSRTAPAAATEAALELIRAIDLYIEQTQPFRLAKDPQQRDKLATILFTCAEALRIASLALWPVMPSKIEQFWQMLGLKYEVARGDFLHWAKWGGLNPGAPIAKSLPLFPRVEG